MSRTTGSIGWRYALALGTTALCLGLVGAIQAAGLDLPTAILLYLVPVVLAASRWGRGPAAAAAVAAVTGHNVVFVEPVGTLTVSRLDDGLSLALLLFTALVTGHLADSARRGALAEREAAVVRRSDELKTALLRIVSHELRTPLASIKASASGLRQPGTLLPDADRAELLAAIEEDADHLNRLVGNLLDASRIEAGTLHPKAGPQDVSEALLHAQGRLRGVLDGRRVLINVPGDLPFASCEYMHLEQALVNIIENAALHAAAPSEIRIDASADTAWVYVDVRDDGPGIAAADRARIFRAFERGATTVRGTGLGLTIALGLIEANGGRLTVESPRRGAWLRIALPRWAEER
ncbi:MAG: DUF4118 domain-containing protein [Chloroflexota bacterium]